MHILLFLLFIGILPASASAPDIMGRWITEKKDAIIEIYDDNGSLSGRMVWIKDSVDESGAFWTDTENPVAALRTRSLRNLVILSGLRAGEEKWEGGNIYDPESGSTYRCWVKPLSAERLEVRGYIGISLLGRSETWSRYTSD